MGENSKRRFIVMRLIVDDAFNLFWCEECSHSSIGRVDDLEGRECAHTDLRRAREPMNVVIEVFRGSIVIEFADKRVDADSLAEDGVFFAIAREEFRENHKVFIRVSCFPHEIFAHDERSAVRVIQAESMEHTCHELHVLFHASPEQRRVFLRRAIP